MQLFLRLNYFFVLKVRRSPLPARALHSCLPRGAGQTVPWRVQVCLPAGSKPWAVTSASGGEVLISFQSGFRKYQFWNEALQVHCLVPQSVTLTMRQCLSKHLFLQKPPFTKLQLRCKSVESHGGESWAAPAGSPKSSYILWRCLLSAADVFHTEPQAAVHKQLTLVETSAAPRADDEWRRVQVHLGSHSFLSFFSLFIVF